jgi:uncharacterized protein YndB with AHSA1/START domain
MSSLTSVDSDCSSLVPGAHRSVVTSAHLPAAPNVVWSALTDPDELSKWLGSADGWLEAVGREVVLDFGDGDFLVFQPNYAGEAVDDPRAYELRATWRSRGIGKPQTLVWRLEPDSAGTCFTMTEEVADPADPSTEGRHRSARLVDQLGAYLASEHRVAGG